MPPPMKRVSRESETEGYLLEGYEEQIIENDVAVEKANQIVIVLQCAKPKRPSCSDANCAITQFVFCPRTFKIKLDKGRV